jgi:RimJ/RimL family protein N-acetyltransferase
MRRYLEPSPALAIRPLTSRDRARVSAGFERLGERSRYLRWGRTYVQPREAIEWVTRLDGFHEFAVGACDTVAGTPIGVARYVTDSPLGAEIAVSVVDDWQGRGVGRILVSELAAHARRCGLRELHASMFHENRAAVRLMRDLGGAMTRTHFGVVEYRAPLTATVPPRTSRSRERPAGRRSTARRG